MARNHRGRVSLDDLLAMTPTIAVVDPTTVVDAHISVELGEEITPFGYSLSRFEVVEFLRPPRAAEPGETLVLDRFRGQAFKLHVDYHARGISRSPVYRGYHRSHAAKNPQEPLIFFLRRGAFLRFDPAAGELVGQGPNWIFSVPGAAEGLAGRAEIAPAPPSSRAAWTSSCSPSAPLPRPRPCAETSPTPSAGVSRPRRP